jgi:hypothetical protein
VFNAPEYYIKDEIKSGFVRYVNLDEKNKLRVSRHPDNLPLT